MRRLVAGVLLALITAGCTPQPAAPSRRGAPSGTPSPARTSASAKARARRPTVRTALAPWHTPAPVSRLTVSAVPGGLLLAGGLVAGTSTGRVYRLDPRTGRFRALGDLAVPTHDAGALALRGRVLVLGGGSSSTTDLVQETGRAGRPGRVAGRLPTPRSDAVAVQAAGTGYLVGGYDGAAPDDRVLATRDGRTFHPVATLPVPVRYAAVAATTGGRLLVLGGLAVGGPHAGAPVDTIQRVDLRRHRATVVGHLPRPLQGAVAVRLGGVVYLAGGRSAASSSAPASRTVFALRGGAVRRVGRLPLAVANAGVAARGHRAWIIGGESGGRTRSSVQTITQEAAARS